MDQQLKSILTTHQWQGMIVVLNDRNHHVLCDHQVVMCQNVHNIVIPAVSHNPKVSGDSSNVTLVE